VLILCTTVLLAGPTALAFFAGGHFDGARVVAAGIAWALVLILALAGPLPFPRSVAGRVAVAGLAGLAIWSAISIAWAPLIGPAADGVELRLIEGREPFAVGAIRVEPFTVPHDAREPVQFVLGDGARRLGVLTDLGTSTAHVEATLSGCDALVLETNHDLDLLWGGDYPKWLKERIGGPFGHLDNAASGRLLAALDRSRLKHVVAAHLSQQNNRAGLARAALAAALGCAEDWVGVATQDEGFGWRELA